jgi:hypothetical protein
VRIAVWGSGKTVIGFLLGWRIPKCLDTIDGDRSVGDQWMGAGPSSSINFLMAT